MSKLLAAVAVLGLAVLSFMTHSAEIRTYRDAIRTPPELKEGAYTIRQLSSGRYLDAYTTSPWVVVTRPAQNNTTQYWYVSSGNRDRFRLRQLSDHDKTRALNMGYWERGDFRSDCGNGRDFGSALQLDRATCVDRGAWIEWDERYCEDYDVGPCYTRVYSGWSTEWEIVPVVGGYRIRSWMDQWYLDAHENSKNDYRVVRRTYQDNNSQVWTFTPLPAQYTR